MGITIKEVLKQLSVLKEKINYFCLCQGVAKTPQEDEILETIVRLEALLNQVGK